METHDTAEQGIVRRTLPAKSVDCVRHNPQGKSPYTTIRDHYWYIVRITSTREWCKLRTPYSKSLRNFEQAVNISIIRKYVYKPKAMLECTCFSLCLMKCLMSNGRQGIQQKQLKPCRTKNPAALTFPAERRTSWTAVGTSPVMVFRIRRLWRRHGIRGRTQRHGINDR